MRTGGFPVKDFNSLYAWIPRDMVSGISAY